MEELQQMISLAEVIRKKTEENRLRQDYVTIAQLRAENARNSTLQFFNNADRFSEF